MVGQVSPWRIGTITHGFEANKGTELKWEDDSLLSLCQSHIRSQLSSHEEYNNRITQDVQFTQYLVVQLQIPMGPQIVRSGIFAFVVPGLVRKR